MTIDQLNPGDYAVIRWEEDSIRVYIITPAGAFPIAEMMGPPEDWVSNANTLVKIINKNNG